MQGLTLQYWLKLSATELYNFYIRTIWRSIVIYKKQAQAIITNIEENFKHKSSLQTKNINEILFCSEKEVISDPQWQRVKYRTKVPKQAQFNLLVLINVEIRILNVTGNMTNNYIWWTKIN